MYKLIKVFNVKEDGNEVKSAEYSVIYEFEQFEIDKKTETMLIDYCKVNNLEYGTYTIVEYKDDKPVAVVGQLFYHSEDDELDSWMDMAEWNERVIASVALGYDIVISEETKRKFSEHLQTQKREE